MNECEELPVDLKIYWEPPPTAIEVTCECTSPQWPPTIELTCDVPSTIEVTWGFKGVLFDCDKSVFPPLKKKRFRSIDDPWEPA